MFTRRTFLKSTFAFLASSCMGESVFEALAGVDSGPHQAQSIGTLLERPIPKSGEKIPIVGLGSWRTFDVANWSFQKIVLKDVLDLFYRTGGRLVDTSPQYARSEQVIGELAGELKINEALFMATKVWTEGGENGMRQMNDSFDLLGVQQMDLMQIHNLMDWKTHLTTLKSWKEEGRIRYLGVTHYLKEAYDELERIMKSEDLDFLQINYSLKEPEAHDRILPLAEDRGIAVIINRPYGMGSLFKRVRDKELPGFSKEIGCETWAQIFLKYVLSHPATTCAIPATSKTHHLLDNMKAGTGHLPDARQRRQIEQLMNNL